MNVKINVTATDLKRGRPFEPGACPVARAIRRRLAPGYGVGVGATTACVYFPGERLFAIDPRDVVVWLPTEACKVISDFDARPDLAKPTTFLLDLPAEVLR